MRLQGGPMSHSLKLLDKLRFFAFCHSMARNAKCYTIFNHKTMLWVLFPCKNMMSLDVSIARLSTHLTCKTIAYKNCFAPIFIFKPRVPHISSILRATFPVRIFFASKATLQTFCYASACFVTQYFPMPWVLWPYTLFCKSHIFSTSC